MQPRQHLRHWVDKSLLGQLLGSQRGVLETGYTLDELEQAIQQRRRVIETIEQKSRNCWKRERNYREKAEEATGIRKQTATLDANDAYRERLRYEQMHLNLSLQQLFLRNLVEHVKEKRFLDNPMAELGLDAVDITAMNREAVVDAIADSAVDQDQPLPDQLQELQWALEDANPKTVTPDLDRLKDGYRSTVATADGNTDYTPNEQLDTVLDEMIDEMQQEGMESVESPPETEASE